MIKFDIITIFPKIFDSYSAQSAEQGSAGLAGSYFNESILGRAQKKKLIKIGIHNLRDFTSDKHKKVDDRPYGGGAGMIFKVEPIFKAVNALKKIKNSKLQTLNKSKIQNPKSKIRVLLFSAKGKTMTQQDVRRWVKYDQLILICGRYEGVDERVAEHIADEEVSVGNYVLTGGEIPAMIVVDAVSRLIPGVLGKKESLEEESFIKIQNSKWNKFVASDSKIQNYYLEYPQYTRPEIFKKWKVPKVLLDGNHKKIKEWRDKVSKKYAEF